MVDGGRETPFRVLCPPATIVVAVELWPAMDSQWQCVQSRAIVSEDRHGGGAAAGGARLMTGKTNDGQIRKQQVRFIALISHHKPLFSRDML